MRLFMYIAAVLVLASLALAAPAGNVNLTATYQEPVQTPTAQLWPGVTSGYLSFNTKQDASLQVTRGALGLSSGTYWYLLDAADANQNRAAYTFQVRTKGPFAITPLAPSTGGMSTTTRFEIGVRTSATATCDWTYTTPIGDGPRNAMQSSDGLTHFSTNFSDNRFIAGESVPVRVSCRSTQGQNASIILPVGWGTPTEPQLSLSITPTPVAAPGDTVTATITGNAMTNCTLNGATLSAPRKSNLGLKHVFSGLPAGGQGTAYTADCTDAYGNDLPQLEGVVTHNYATGSLQVVLTQPPDGITRSLAPVIGVSTNMPATCQQNFGTPNALGPLAGEREHQRAVTLTEGSHSGSFSCTTTDGVKGVLTTTITTDTTPPDVKIAQPPEVCGKDVLVDVHGTDASGVSGVIISANGQEVYRGWPSGDAHLFRQADLGVKAGDAVTVQGVDEAGNIGGKNSVAAVQSTNQNCDVQGITQQLQLVNPQDGNAQGTDWTLAVQSEVPSTCSWRVLPKSTFTDFSSVSPDKTLFTESGFPSTAGIVQGSSSTVEVKCTDAAGQDTIQQFPIAWNLSKPTITAKASPNPVKSIDTQMSTVSVTSDQQVRCDYDEGPFTDYNTTHAFPVAMPYGTGSRVVNVSCINRNGKESNRSVTITEDYPSALSIVVTTPRFIGTPQVPLTVRTSMLADCTATGAGKTAKLSTLDGVSHTGTLQLPDGTTNVTYTCTERDKSAHQTSVQQPVTVDTTGPSVVLKMPAYTCGFNQLLVAGTVTDNSGVSSVNISLLGKTYTTTSLPYTIKNLNLTENKTYTVSVTATDKAGNTAPASTAQVMGKNASDGACDTTPPVVRLNQKAGNDGVRVWLNCTDNVACADAYAMGVGAPDGACTLTDEKFSENYSVLLTNTSKVCWHVEDVNGQVTEGHKVVDVQQYPATCTDGIKDANETGLDCGGPCAPCDSGNLTCKTSADCGVGGICSSGTCYQAQVTSCTADADCGAGSTCVQGECRVPVTGKPPVCTFPSDCSANATCGQNDTCYVQGASSCSTSSDCGAGEYCVFSQCSTVTPPISGCTNDSACPQGAICSQGTCWAPHVTSCAAATDCAAGGACMQGACYAASQASDTCVTGTDCVSGVCDSTTNTCTQSGCNNGIKDGQETAVDCGGPSCGACGAGKSCLVNSDCQSANCVQGVCQAPTCTDGIKNQDETDIDCGGTVCQPCSEGSACLQNSDCATDICSGTTCTNQTLQVDNPSQLGNGSSYNYQTSPTSGLSWFAIVLIVIGVLLMGSGGGYIYYERNRVHAPRRTTGPPVTGGRSTGGQSSTLTPITPKEDYATSKLREEARKRRRSTRVAGRKDLLSAFDEEKAESQAKTVKKPSKPAVKTAPEKPVKKAAIKDHTAPEKPVVKRKETPKEVFERLDSLGRDVLKKRFSVAKTPAAIRDLARSLMTEGRAKPHAVDAALADMHASGLMSEKDLNKLREDLEL